MKNFFPLFIIPVLMIFACCSATNETNKRSNNSNEMQSSNKQIVNKSINDTTVYKMVEVMPEYTGGKKEMKKYIAQNIDFSKIPPLEPWGSFYVKFVVNKYGKTEQIKTIKCPHPDLEKQAIELVKNMPQWKSGRSRGENVNVWYTITIYEPL